MTALNKPPALIFLDTCVLLEDPNVLDRVRKKNGQPVISTVVLRELDKFKTDPDERGRNARETFRKIGTKGKQLKDLNSTTAIIFGDTATEFGDHDKKIVVIHRTNYISGATNDDKIIEVAENYGMKLLSRDRALVTRAQALGAEAIFWQHTAPRQAQPTGSTGLPPFESKTQPFAASSKMATSGPVPKLKDAVFSSTGEKIVLRERVASGGEGTIYSTDANGYVAKIYDSSRLTVDKRSKIELMLTRSITRSGICWPKTILNDRHGNFVGYLMPRADGRTIQSTMFVKPVLLKTFPNWKRIDLVNVGIAFLEHMEFLHSLNIVVGDINPMNLLVSPDSTKLYIVDTDSFQIDGYPCPVGTVNFTPARRQGQSYTNYLRTKDDELFAIATMLFMILHPGKPPYAQQGGGTASENIRNKEFPYWYRTSKGEIHSAEKAPEGPWQTIWANLPWDIRGAFHQCFREDNCVTIERWLQLLRKYKNEISSDRLSNDLFPESFPVKDPISLACARCSSNFVGSKRQIENRRARGFDPWCPACFRESKLRKLANDNFRATNQQSMKASPTRSVPSFGSSHSTKTNSGLLHSKQQPASNGSGGLGWVAAIAVGLAALLGW